MLMWTKDTLSLVHLVRGPIEDNLRGIGGSHNWGSWVRPNAGRMFRMQKMVAVDMSNMVGPVGQGPGEEIGSCAEDGAWAASGYAEGLRRRSAVLRRTSAVPQTRAVVTSLNAPGEEVAGALPTPMCS